MEAKEIIKELGLSPHPEGGYYRRLFSSDKQTIEGKGLISSIYYLLEGEDFSAFHRLSSVELWFFHIGEPINIYILNNHGKLETHTLSSDLNDSFQLVVKPNTWFAAEIPSKKGFSLVSCAVSPMFSFNNFYLANKEELINYYPEHQSIINRLTR
ncbi:MAG: cupin domain-containing protein [Bacteroidales bacterium]|nr:cupin domain-containing protein [Bacteroidales bacterium]MDD4684108.1 cupin domain-containing protein [Bacteroidales bacterium]